MSALMCLFCTSVLSAVAAAVDSVPSHFHIGCYSDDRGNPDLSGSKSSLGRNSTADQCIAGCQAAGYPYCALNKVNSECYCGNSFGKYGKNTDCDQSCDGLTCGGEDSNSVYYTVDTSASASGRRLLLYVPLSRSFDEARADCVRQNGDLPSINDLGDLNDTLRVVRSKGIRLVKVWIGMKLNETTMTYDWVNPTSPKYGSTGSNLFLWKPDDAQSACVLLNVDSEQMETAPCNVPYSYVCKSLPHSPGEVYTPANPGDVGNQRMALYVVLPLFLLCYGGSCLAYCARKLYRNCRLKPYHSTMTFATDKKLDQNTSPKAAGGPDGIKIEAEKASIHAQLAPGALLHPNINPAAFAPPSGGPEEKPGIFDVGAVGGRGVGKGDGSVEMMEMEGLVGRVREEPMLASLQV